MVALKYIRLFCWGGILLAQHVGIGLTAPQARLHIRGVTHTAASHALRVDDSQGAPILAVRDDGNVGIGTVFPAQRVEVIGNLRLEGDFRPAGNPGVSGQILYSQGPNLPPTWGELPFKIAYMDIWSPSNQTAQGWSGAGVTNCGGQYMLGGYNQCGSGCVLSKTYVNLPPHSEVVVEVFYWALDSWEQNSTGGLDHIRLELDGTIVARGTSTQFDSNNTGLVNTSLSFCGHDKRVDQGPIRVSARIAHATPNLSVSIISQLNQSANDESVGVTAVWVWVR